MTFYYFKPSGRKTIMARIWSDGNPVDISTGIKCPYEFVNQKAKGRSHEVQQINASIGEWEVESRKKLAEAKDIIGTGINIKEILKSKKPIVHHNHSFQGFLSMYESLLREGLVYNNGNPLSYDTVKTVIFTIATLKNTDVDINFQKYNVISSKVIGLNIVYQMYEDFAIKLKNSLSGYAPGTIFNYILTAKKIIGYCAERVGIELPQRWTKIISYSKPSYGSDIFVLPVKHTDYLIEHFQHIINDHCDTEKRKAAMQYCLVAILLCPRKRDMTLWDKNNLVFKNDRWWLKYVPSKTKSSSSVTIEVVVPNVLTPIFLDNMKKYGKLMPPYEVNNINSMLRTILKRIDIFHDEIQFMKRGKLIKAKICDAIFIHGLRATGISHKLAKNMPELVAKMYSGHTKNSTSWERYVHVYEDNMVQAHEDYMKKLQD